MGLFYSYKKAGSGIDKNAPEKNRIVLFFEILVRKFWKIMEVNLLYFIFFLPLFLGYYSFISVSNITAKLVVTIACAVVFAVCFGPATAGLFKVIRNYSLERHSFIISDFKKGFTEKILGLSVFTDAIFIVSLHHSRIRFRPREPFVSAYETPLTHHLRPGNSPCRPCPKFALRTLHRPL